MPYRRGRDAGQVAIEYLGFVPVLLIVGLAGFQIGAVAYAAEQAGTAARAGARAASLRQDAQQACAEAVSGGLTVRCSPAEGGDTVTVTASVGIPSIVPGWHFDPAEKSATMPLDH
ncbi:Flp pilus assembly protein TadG [Streptomyces griseochromogenes]|uniref:Flp pilus assembly protein TadG n=1 Tax=Streptomyces griseochromogenes TaxID=68214 RepID=A0A1B1ARH7_9ACTN|nr:TadE/TadG family type IV pilus assembly protein [Streptomyces griseochromogenes]ANP49161.1 septum formation initiator [Streptomyces griseochromogenes]MBP2049305.1 Flp pilus assembly protein TadG [Streptomyces griseochromogenes]